MYNYDTGCYRAKRDVDILTIEEKGVYDIHRSDPNSVVYEQCQITKVQ